MSPAKRTGRWPLRPPSVARFKRVGWAALNACMYGDDAGFAPEGYNATLLSVWASMKSSRTIPSASEVAEALEGLYELLADEGTSEGILVGGPQDRALKAAKARLDGLRTEALGAALLRE